jgi:hypothetical protein
MPDTSRRAVLAGAAGLAAGSALSLPEPVLAQEACVILVWIFRPPDTRHRPGAAQ